MGFNSRSAVHGLHRRRQDIQALVGTVAPGFIETDRVAPILNGERGEDIKKQSPLGRVARPEEVARGVLFLASEGTEFMTGAILDINGASYLRS